MNFRDIVTGDWSLFTNFIWNFLYSVWPIVVPFVAIAAFGLLLTVVINALREFRRG